MKYIVCLLLSMVAISAYSDRIVITGQPTVLEVKDNVYYVPTNYVPMPKSTYMYVTIGGVHRVCFLHPEPTLGTVEVTQVNIVVKGDRVLWNCYPYNTTYFEARP